ncbi:PREDICTED: cytochrome P450 71A1-like [Erythranthe guttata]|uniref:cytochrome P450 71A1-like n=1 Tax=Erythranthe guttata TaxID=4155 RepID=UPI00064DA7F9|nr:PREDICTED: cytochrome P450 71A1-like [Erythranthe guttata]|eukprot:XP_012829422.1 PREDICTED: cytochrome P450 71A1-like [Erythranthe guttata]
MNRKVRGVEEDLDEFLDFVVKEHLKGGGIRGNEKDFVDVLLDIRRNDEGGFVLEESSIKALVLDMFAAGIDTTYTLLIPRESTERHTIGFKRVGYCERDPILWENPERFLRNSVELVLANVVLSFEFELPGGASGEDLDMREGDGLTIHRKFPLKVVARCESLP